MGFIETVGLKLLFRCLHIIPVVFLGGNITKECLYPYSDVHDKSDRPFYISMYIILSIAGFVNTFLLKPKVNMKMKASLWIAVMHSKLLLSFLLSPFLVMIVEAAGGDTRGTYIFQFIFLLLMLVVSSVMRFYREYYTEEVKGAFLLRNKLMNCASYQNSEIIAIHKDVVTSILMLFGDSLVIAASQDGTIRFFELKSRKLMRVLFSNPPTTTLLYCRKYRILIGISGNTIGFWNISTYKCLRKTQLNVNKIWAVSEIDRANIIALADEEGAIVLLEIFTFKITLVGNHGNSVLSIISIEYTPLLVTGGRDSKIKIWNHHNNELISILSGHSLTVAALAYDPTLDILYSGGFDSKILAWNFKSRQILLEFQGHTKEVKVLHLSKRKKLYSGGGEGKILLWDEKGNYDHRFLGHKYTVYGVAVTANDASIVSCSVDKTVRVWTL